MVQKKQLNALIRKSWAYQRKNWCMNVCVLVSPIVVCGLLAILQSLVGALIGDDGKCGCQCTQCKINGTTISDVRQCNSQAEEIDCLTRNEDVCAFEYSTSSQALYCEIMTPSRWPTMYNLNNANVTKNATDEGERVPPLDSADKPVTFMYTSSQPSSFIDSAMNKMVRQPDIQALLQPDNLDSFQVLESQSSGAPSYDLSALSNVGWDFGTSNALYPLLLDSGWLPLGDDGGAAAMSIVSNCTELQSLVGAAVSPAPNGSQTTNPVDGDLGFTSLLGGCADGRVLRQPSTAEIDDFIFCSFDPEDTEDKCDDQTHAANAYDWKASAASKLDLDIYQYDPAVENSAFDTMKRVAKPLERAVNSWLQSWLGEGYKNQVISNMDMPKPGTQLNIDLVSFLGPLFFVWLVQLPLPWALVQLVYEKQHRLRSMMRMHGLSNGVYMLVMYLYFILQFLLYTVVLFICGYALRLQYFIRNNFGVQLVFYILYGLVQVAFAFLLSCFFTNSRTANIATWIWLLGTGLFAQNLLPNVFSEGRDWAVALQLIPSFGAYRGLWELGEYAFRAAYQDSTGMQFSDLSSEGNGMGAILIIFVFEAPIFMLLAWYLEQVLPSGIGIRKPWNFPCTGKRKRGAGKEGPPLTDGISSDVTNLDLGGDVLRERDAAYATPPSADHPILVRDLQKTFPPLNGNPAKTAVHNMSLAVPRGECFGLLGPNGAGKTTSINMMIGFLEASAGEAHICGLDIKRDMNEIYTLMGVCPQHDLLWETLTAREHLCFYARLKGLAGPALTVAVDEALHSVKLFDVANKRAGQFSGGMKRRLSVAISLIGSPSVTYLDEPSTGLDPASRRQLWKVVDEAKQGKAVILTTHSMEEAEVLCDRIGIFIGGKLACIGAPKALAARFGGFNVFTITTSDQDAPAADAMVRSMSPNAIKTYEIAGTLKYELPKADISLSNIFEVMSNAGANGVEVLDWGVHSASLEDVFIRLANAKEEEASELAGA